MMTTTSTHPFVRAQRTVLLIGNSRGILKLIAFALQRRGHSVIWGDSGDAGLRIAEVEEPHLVICETRLHDQSGFDVCRTIKSSLFFSTPVVLIGRIQDEGRDLIQAYKAGADDFFGSFADYQLVLAKLEWLIRRRDSDTRQDRSEIIRSLSVM